MTALAQPTLWRPPGLWRPNSFGIRRPSTWIEWMRRRWQIWMAAVEGKGHEAADAKGLDTGYDGKGLEDTATSEECCSPCPLCIAGSTRNTITASLALVSTCEGACVAGTWPAYYSLYDQKITSGTLPLGPWTLTRSTYPSYPCNWEYSGTISPAVVITTYASFDGTCSGGITDTLNYTAIHARFNAAWHAGSPGSYSYYGYVWIGPTFSQSIFYKSTVFTPALDCGSTIEMANANTACGYGTVGYNGLMIVTP
jgi:hypothetical protein